ncbi:hypothetical protein [Rhizobium sp.]|uniref:hypothetical protein n=1 Tax=Rhizobium sp. TaxID=391 RepID=UPI0028A03C2B
MAFTEEVQADFGNDDGVWIIFRQFVPSSPRAQGDVDDFEFDWGRTWIRKMMGFRYTFTALSDVRALGGNSSSSNNLLVLKL